MLFLERSTCFPKSGVKDVPPGFCKISSEVQRGKIGKKSVSKKIATWFFASWRDEGNVRGHRRWVWLRYVFAVGEEQTQGEMATGCELWRVSLGRVPVVGEGKGPVCLPSVGRSSPLLAGRFPFPFSAFCFLLPTPSPYGFTAALTSFLLPSRYQHNAICRNLGL